MAASDDSLQEIIDPIITENGFELIRVRVTGSNEKTVQIMAERADKTMSAEDCARLSRAISAVFEESDPIEGRYILEVSSPGIDRPLTRLNDFHDWQGYRAKIELNRLVEGRKRLQGVLAGIENDNIYFDIDSEEETAVIPFSWIAQAKLVLTDELISQSLKAAKSALKTEDGEDLMANTNGAVT